MASTQHVFESRSAHRAWLTTQSALPRGFRVGTTRFDFVPFEVSKQAKMTLTLIALERPSPDFAAVFTKNAFPGAPVIIGRKRLGSPGLGAILVNNKISNVCAPGGVEVSEGLCRKVARLLDFPESAVLPSSTGVIGWRLPVEAMVQALPNAVSALSGESILPAADGIVTTDLYPKVRRIELAGGSIVGIAKGAGMIEPNLATMLVYILTDLAVPREALRAMLTRAVDQTFNRMSIDSDTSTSDTVVAWSSSAVPVSDLGAVERALTQVCADLTEDIVRNGEGVHHVMRVTVRRAPDEATARAIGKAVVNAPLFKCAVAGNDPNVGRLVQAVGKYVGAHQPSLDLSRINIRLGGIPIVESGEFLLDPSKEGDLLAHLRGAELYASAEPKNGVFVPPIDFPPHERCVEIDIDLGLGSAESSVLGADLSHEYVSENADYRS
ncbi:MAG TPA: bifunctional ornithine acetyltransferase/N-acetylglutamate synthase [Polyangiaceae bacterium]|nr:bifunctional ornithine acetyltransferase/N-acetylglutamate synthase [Polyangiaceae bacterium]